jgi:thiol-disulfide isomerase/thioredoxin
MRDWMRNSLLAIGCLGALTAELRAQGVIEFVQNGCAACQRIEPVVVKLEREGVRFVRHTATAGDPLCQSLGVQVTPTFIAVDRSGREVQRIVGPTREAALRALVRKAYAGGSK